MIERRIQFGAYLGRDLPAEREIASDLQVSRMTARKALQQLVDQGVIERQDNGRLAVRRAQAAEFVILVPSIASTEIEHLRLGLERAARDKGSSVHTRLYLHWDDPVITEALDAYQGVFIASSCAPIPPRLLDRLAASPKRIVALGRDLTAIGVPSMDLLPPHALQHVLDHLAQQGHTVIDCLNTQTRDPIIDARLEQWQLWLATHHMTGKLFDSPIPPYESPFERGYRDMQGLLRKKALTGTALFCTTMPAAIGAARALCDAGRRPGGPRPGDIAVAAFSDESLGRYMAPSITSLINPRAEPYFAICIDWMRQPSAGWVGPLLMRAAEPTLLKGESTAAQRG